MFGQGNDDMVFVLEVVNVIDDGSVDWEYTTYVAPRYNMIDMHCSSVVVRTK